MEVRGDRIFILNILPQEVKRLFMMLNGNHVMKCEVMPPPQQAYESIQR